MDEQVLIETPRGKLVGMVHLPDGGPAATGIVFCHAFAEERKSSSLVMARLARAIADAGLPALRFDYCGSGDSEGEFIDATPESRLEDIASATAFLKERTGVERVALLGLRLGATFAALAAESMADCAGLILVEPITDGQAYLGGEMRRKLLRQMLTDGRTGTSRAEMLAELERDDAILDMDGFAIRGSTYKALTALGIRVGEVSFAGPVVICQVHFKEDARPDIEAACEAYRAAGADVQLERIVLPPFWSRIEVGLAPELEAAVTAWLPSLLGP